MQKRMLQLPGLKRLTLSRGSRLGRGAVVILVFAGIGLFTLSLSHAASYASSVEAESGTLTAGANVVADSSASGGSAVQFGSSSEGGSGTRTTNCTPVTSAPANESIDAAEMDNTTSHLCGFPDTTNTGATGTLYALPGSVTAPNANTGSGWTYNSSTGVITMGADGVLKNVSINASDEISILVTGNGATIDNISMDEAGNNQGNGVDLPVAVQIGTGSTPADNTTIEHSSIFGEAPSSTANNAPDPNQVDVMVKDISGSSTGTQVLYNNFYYGDTDIQMSNGLIKGNYIHNMAYVGDEHINGMTDNGGSGLTIENNTVFNSFSQTDAISLFEDFGAISNVVIDDNLVAGGGYCMYGGQNSGGAAASNVQITNNHFSRMFYQDCGGQGGGVIAAWPLSGSGGVWSGNVWDDTGASVSD